VPDLADYLRQEAETQRAWQRRHQGGRKFAAGLRGNFWMPCPLCGEEFGGHEWIGNVMLPDKEPGMSRGVCPACELDLRILALPYCEEHGHSPTAVLGEATFTDRADGTMEASLPYDPEATPIRAYCLVCGSDLPIDT